MTRDPETQPWGMEAESPQTPKIDHQVLARKYRPQKFADVVEQQTAVRALKNAVENDRLGSAYLFFGPRGVGKTTIARLLARRVNCESPVQGEACGNCDSCISIREGNALDVIEIDAASHRGIANIRELRENVKFQPMTGKMKVYIIDEVHMLTMESFNALLKTLEEPPRHVLFILATTEYNKIPETILSRCQVFIFRKVPLKTVQNYMATICEKEGIPYEEEALFWIARKGDGSVRDSLSFLELAITYGDRNIKTDEVRELVGATWTETLLTLIEAILNPDSTPESLVEPVHKIFQEGGDLNRFVWEFLDFLRVSIHIRNGIKDPEFLGIPPQEISRIETSVSSADPVVLSRVFDKVYHLLTDSYALRIRNSYESRVLIEMALYDLKEEISRPSISGLIKKINRLGASIHQGTPYSPEEDLKETFLGTRVDPGSIPGPDLQELDQ